MIEAQAINHIGIAVHSIEKQRVFYEEVLGARFEAIEEVAGQQVRVAFFLIGTVGCEVRIELLEPMSEESPISKFLAKHGEGMHHIAYTVNNIQKRLEALKVAGFRLINDKPRAGAHGMQIAFLHPASSGGVLTELCEEGNESLGEDYFPA